MSFFSAFAYSLRSFVQPFSSEKTATIFLKNGSETDLASFVDTNVPAARSGYWYWNKLGLGNGHLQTLNVSLQAMNEHENVAYYGRRLFTWKSGATISVDYALDTPTDEEEWTAAESYVPKGVDGPKPPIRTRYLTKEELEKFDDPKETRPIFINLHGLSGGSHEGYVRAMACYMKAHHPEFDVAVINSRGCARTKLTKPILFNAALTEDIRQVVKHIRRTQPERKIFLAGFSLGGAILANYLGQEGGVCEISGAACICAPWDLRLNSVALMNSFWGRQFYDGYMAGNLMKLLKRNLNELKDLEWLQKEYLNPPAKTVSDYDDRFTSQMFGFDSAADYYRNASPVNRLRHVRVPLLMVGALDDPIVSRSALPFSEVARNPFLYMLNTTTGGHLGFYQAGDVAWNIVTVSEFFSALNSKVDRIDGNTKIDVSKSTRQWVGDHFVWDSIPKSASV